ncbi:MULTISPECIES: hypothetical protein [unclassified Pseudoalteromonas]|nr:hypothetical protein [Pseudoalteromonas sp. XMcav2-N]MCO7191350.1 hypothetical protein [Pseudoalteromonas sp. XMcav2-N]
MVAIYSDKPIKKHSVAVYTTRKAGFLVPKMGKTSLIQVVIRKKIAIF